MEFFEKLFDTDFMPHGHCYFWDPAIVWTNAISDSLTALAYFTIPFTLLHIVRVRKDLNFTPLIILFAVFILSCGATHIMDVINIWSPLYRLDSSLRAITAIASTATAFMLVRITPQILKIPNSNQYQKLNEELKAQITLLKERDQTIELLKKNRELETVIAESEARFKLIFDNSLASIVVSDDQGNYLSANKAAADLFGYEVNELLQMNVGDLKTTESQETTRRFEDYISKGEETGEFDFISKNGALKFVQYQAVRPKADFNLSIIMDVTAQKEAQLKLKASEEKYRRLFETMEQGFCIIEMIFDGANQPVDYLFIEANPMFEKHSGTLNPVGKTIRQLVPTIEERWYQVYGNVSLTGASIHFIDFSEALNRWFEVYAFRLGDEASKKVAVLFTDITESKESQQKIAASENQFRTFADSIQNLAWIAHGDGWIYWYNKQWYDYTGTTLEEMQGWGWQKVHHPEHVQKITEISKELWKKDEPFELTFPLRRHDGEYRWFLTRAYPVKDTNGNIAKWIGTNTDVTEQKTFAEELEAKVNERTEALSFKTNQLQELNQILESRNVELDKMNKELESFTYISSHDLQEPLRKIQTFASLIAEKENDNLSTNGKDLFQRMQASAKRMQSLIEDLLAYSRTKSLKTNFEKVDLSSVVAIVVSDLKEEIQQKNALIEVNNTCEVNIIPFQFQQLFYNLISNSLKFSNPEKRLHITITTEQSQGSKSDNNELIHGKNYCHIIVADNGIGFEPQYNEKIFELFQRLHGRNEYNGTGIGLAIVKKIVENHHGVITAKGELGEGATFDIYIPIDSQ
ncbi:PAS domain S-box protein [soil metagenome]